MIYKNCIRYCRELWKFTKFFDARYKSSNVWKFISTNDPSQNEKC